MDAAPSEHPTRQILSSFSLGKLDDASALAVSLHLEQCADCRNQVAEMPADSFLGRVRDARAPARSPYGQSLTSHEPWKQTGSQMIAPPPSDTLPPGLANHRDYEIVRELGRGGMGVVYLAQNKLMGRLEVLKVVGSHLSSRPGVLDRFHREIRSAANLHHNNIVTAYAALRFDEGLVLAMEYVEGHDLARMVKVKGQLPVAHSCNYIHQAANGLQHAYERGMVHRDIKPANLILASSGKNAIVKVLDFGLAKVTSEGRIDGSLTREGQMLGTPDFISPEQIRDAQSADTRADIYSLGCTLYYLLTGAPPFRGDNLWDIYQAHLSMDAAPLNLARPDVPAELGALVAKMMAKEPARRFQTPGEVASVPAPYFKTAAAAKADWRTEFSGVVGHDEATATSAGGIGPMPALTAASLGGPIVTQAEAPALEDSKPPSAAPNPPVSERSSGRRRWLWASVAAAVLVLGMLVAFWQILKVTTADGMIELVNLPKGAEVFVDGHKIDVTFTRSGKHAMIRSRPGKHAISVLYDGFEITGDEIIVDAGGIKPFVVRWLEIADSTSAAKPGLGQDVGGRTSAPTDRPADSKSPEAPKAPPPNSTATPTGTRDTNDTRADAAGHLAVEPARPLANDEPRLVRGPATVVSGAWRLEGDDLVQTESIMPGEDPEPTEGLVVFGDPGLARYNLQFKAMVEQRHGGFGAIFHCTDRNNLCSVSLGQGGKDLCSFVFNGMRQPRDDWTKPRQLQPGGWHDVRLRVQE
jgi:serine/threonine protein kinase